MKNSKCSLPEIIQVKNGLLLRSVALTDAEYFLKIIIENQNYFSKFDFISPTFTTLEEVEKVIGHLINFKNDQMGANYGLWNKEKLIGLFTINEIDWDAKVADIGFWLVEGASSKGHAFLALQSLMESCWKSLNMNALKATTATTNNKCQKLLEKSGFKKIEILKDNILVRNKKIDEFLYRIEKI
ncbi:MAG: GNAT family N-acetyltransferase [Bacteriovorax sp.]